MKKNIKNYDLDKLKEELKLIGEKPFRAEQIFKWLYQDKVTSFGEMTNLSLDLRKKLEENYSMGLFKIEKKLESVDGTKKYLFDVQDDKGNLIESVLMQYHHGYTICVSSQIGCKMGCKFCASTGIPFSRDLEAGEIVEQLLAIERDTGIKISNIVFMGIGEPLDNYDNVMKFIRIINDPKGINIGIRHITLSTCGLVPKIKDFTKEEFGVNLAISLHAPTDEIRNKIMPINKVYNIKSIIDAIKEYIKVTNRRVTFEYILLKDINDSKEDAKKLAELLKGINCYVNLIPYNETSNFEYKTSNKVTINEFYDILKKSKINVTIRREFGSKVSAACGQLRSKHIEKKED